MDHDSIFYLVKSIGWLGTGLFIIAYLQLNTGKWTVQTRAYHIFNILGGLCLVMDTAYDHSYAALIANLMWGLIGIYGLVIARRKSLKTPE